MRNYSLKRKLSHDNSLQSFKRMKYNNSSISDVIISFILKTIRRAQAYQQSY